MFAVMYGSLGLIVGSFVNVVVLRSGVFQLSGRSACMSCGKKIPWSDLIPVFSWVFLRGKCRACGSRISVQYPIVESLMGVSFVLVGLAPLSPLAKILGLLISAVLIAIVAYDILHTIIPDAWVWSFNALALISVFLPEGSLTAIDTTAGPVVAAPLFLLWLFSKGRWMGLGDAKLALGIGWLLGPLSGIEALLLAFVIGAIIGLALIFFSSDVWRTIVSRFTQPYFSKWGQASLRSTSGFTMRSEVPFGPFLALACMFQWFALMYNIPIPFLVL